MRPRELADEDSLDPVPEASPQAHDNAENEPLAQSLDPLQQELRLYTNSYVESLRSELESKRTYMHTQEVWLEAKDCDVREAVTQVQELQATIQELRTTIRTQELTIMKLRGDLRTSRSSGFRKPGPFPDSPRF